MEMPKEYYTNFGVDDFTNDDDFVIWVKYPDRKEVQYWNTLADAMPEKKQIIEAAKNIVFLLSKPETLVRENSRSRIWDNIQGHIIEQAQQAENPGRSRRGVIKIWSRVAIAAAAVVLFILAGYLFNQVNRPKQAPSQATTIVPGTTDATLTLANGQKILLSNAVNGKVATEGSLSITKTQQGQLVYQSSAKEAGQFPRDAVNSLSTANGQTYKLVLPDGSKVWINASSNLTYSPALLRNGKRVLKLDGEAYFEVAKDAQHPFIVETRSQQVQVLGTHFNINAYADEPAVATTLLEGSVKLTVGNNAKTLVPGQQGQTAKDQIAISNVDVDGAVDWKGGDFYLDHLNFKAAMRKIARWYNVDVIYEASVPDDIESGGWISRDKPLSAVLHSIEASGLVKFRIEGRKIYISR